MNALHEVWHSITKLLEGCGYILIVKLSPFLGAIGALCVMINNAPPAYRRIKYLLISKRKRKK